MSSSPSGIKRFLKKAGNVAASSSLATTAPAQVDQSVAAAIMAFRSGGDRKRTISVGGVSPLARLASRQMQTSSIGANLSHSSLDDRKLYQQQPSAGSMTTGGGGAGGNSNQRFQRLPNDIRLKTKGNIFIHRTEYVQLIEQIPLLKRSLVHTKFEDDGPFGNDESRIGLLSQLSEIGKTEIPCAVCHKVLPIYDRYPLIDGTLFFSPISHYSPESEIDPISLKPILHNHHHHRGSPSTHGKTSARTLFINALCIECMFKLNLHCIHCKGHWNFQLVVIGTLYHYDIICAQPCCNSWQICDYCKKWSLKDSVNNAIEQPILLHFSHVDDEFSCVHCGYRGRHCLKPVHSMLRISATNPQPDPVFGGGQPNERTSRNF